MRAAGGSIVGRLPHLKRIDWWLVCATIALVMMGLMAIYSVTDATKGGEFGRQLRALAIGAVPFFVFFLVDPAFWRRIANVLYGINAAMLILVLQFGQSRGEAQRWLQIGWVQFQPSELAKLLLVLTLASFFAARQAEIKQFKTFALSLVHVVPIAFLVFKQPHLGATFILLLTWVVLSLYAGVPTKFLLGALLSFVLLGVIAVKVPGVLEGYQIRRVQDHLHGTAEKGRFQVWRAQIAYGAGGVLGTGFLKGEQKKGRYIPEQETDFIFTVIGEEAGLVGCSLAICAFGFLLFRGWLVAFRANDAYSRMVAAGIITVLGAHTVINLAMTMGLVPVVGLWLPFLSYGGTALWLCLASVGLLLNMRCRESPLLFC